MNGFTIYITCVDDKLKNKFKFYRYHDVIEINSIINSRIGSKPASYILRIDEKKSNSHVTYINNSNYMCMII